MLEHCSANAEAMDLNPVKALNVVFGLKFAVAFFWYLPFQAPFPTIVTD